jgi:hypothetical protein
MIYFMIKWSVAAIPALIVLFLFYTGVAMFGFTFLSGLGTAFSHAQ